MAKKEQTGNNIFLNQGLNIDFNGNLQPQGTYSHALNLSDQSILRELGYSYFEASNEKEEYLGKNRVILGSVYMSDGEVCLISTDGRGKDEIGIFNTKLRQYSKVAELDLGLKTTHQIEIIFRMRLGCEKTIYFTDNLNPLRYFNLSRPQLFKEGDVFAAEKFNFFGTNFTIPFFSSIKTKEGGQLPAGQVFVAMQYIDDDQNKSHPIIVSQGIKIYADSTSMEYDDITGSTGEQNDFVNSPHTSKGIEITLGNLNEAYNFYRLIFINYSLGTGNITDITYSSPINIGNNTFFYTGDNVVGKMSIEEFQTPPVFYERVKNILSIDNSLLAANIQGPQLNLCYLQKYASKIKANVAVKLVKLNDINDPFSPKNPTGEMWLMPGEIYSYGIEYILEGNYRTPVYHIPGRSPEDNDTKNLMGKDNFCISSLYTSQKRNSCGDSEDYWGEDYTGTPILGTNIRHHRLPSRRELNLDPVYYNQKVTQIYKEVEITLYRDAINTEYKSDKTSLTVTLKYLNEKQVEITASENYIIDLPETLEDITLKLNPVPGLNSVISVVISEIPNSSQVLSGIKLKSPSPTNIKTLSTKQINSEIETYAFGIEFSNIILPETGEIQGKKIIGYQILRQERKETDKTILDTGILTPSLVSDFYSTVGMANLELRAYPQRGDVIKVSPNKNPNIFKKIANETIYSDTAEINSELREIIAKIKLLQKRIKDLSTRPKTPSVLNIIVLLRVEITTLEIQKQQIEAAANSGGNVNIYGLSEIYYDPIKFTRGMSDPKKSVSKVSGNIFGLISPRHKFENRDINGISEIIIEGFYYDVKDLDRRQILLQDVQEGTSYNPEVHKKKYADFDGMSLKIGSRLPSREYVRLEEEKIITTSDIGEIFFLDALFSKVPRLKINNKREIFNVLGDNRMGVVELSNPLDPGYVFKKAPYVVLKRYISNPYSNFQFLPYYRQGNNIVYATNGEKSSVTVFSGDVTMTSMAPTHSIFCDIAFADRPEKSGTCEIIIGIVISIGAIVGAVFTGGATLSALGAGLSMISSGIKKDKAIQVYQSLWTKGLRASTTDYDVLAYGAHVKGKDDEIRWIMDNTSEIFFESSINMHLRYKPTIDLPSYMDNNGDIEALESHSINKLTVLDPDKGDARGYRGYPMSELYLLNKDYSAMNNHFIDLHLPANYDCCSECRESFPERIIYSEKSFSDEMTDNYRTFLANNFKSMPGDTGEITNLIYSGGILYVHTEEAIYKLPRASREIVKDQMVTFIGDGSFFSLPENKLVEDNTGNSVGLKYKFSTCQFLGGYFFMSKEGNPYILDGGKLENLSIKGMSKFFNEDKIYNTNLTPDNPSGNGTGYHSTYDAKNQRILLTKTDRGHSWTLGYSLKDQYWLSFYSYIPNRYISVGEQLFSFNNYLGQGYIWRHGENNKTLKFYDEIHPFEVEIKTPTVFDSERNSMTVESVSFQADYYKSHGENYIKDYDKTFSKAYLYNSSQTTGEIKFNLKQEGNKKNILFNSIQNSKTSTNISRIENRYSFNNIKDNVKDYNSPIKINNQTKMNTFTEFNKYIEKYTLNYTNISESKVWSDKQPLRDTYVSLRLIFDKQTDTENIALHYITINDNQSFR